ncbi:MAG TPA: methyltransferase [Xanthobacteraceae bacterium]|nr:methyltransferase [Xanthobacteraceae bacterium]
MTAVALPAGRTQDTAHQSAAEAAATLRRLANGLRVSQALFVAAQLGVADRLAERPLDRFELATLTGADAAALGRVMRTLCALGIFSQSPSGQFSLRPVGQFLRSELPGSYRAGVLFQAGAVRWLCWSQLLDTVRTGVSASERLLGKPLFEFYAANPEESKIHDDAMRAASASHARTILDALDLTRDGVVVDIGGGSGELLTAILAANCGLRGILFDLPDVIDRAVPGLAAIGDRCAVERGSFFERVPRNGDIYLLKQILHDWDDERAGAILRCARRCMPDNARLVVIERKLPEVAAPEADLETFLTDLEMLVMTSGGRERTEAEFRSLLVNARFEPLRKVPTASPLFLFEARAA